MLHGGSYGDEPWPSRSGASDVEPGQRLGELREVAPVARHAVQADDPRRAGSPHSWSEERQAASVSSESGTISVRFSSLGETYDQMIEPDLSIRNVPRCGAPLASLNTP